MQNLINSIWNWFQFIVDLITALFWIIKALFLWLYTLLNSLWSIIENVITSTVFYNIHNALWYISNFIWWPATVILSSLLVISMIRIWIAFVFKILRLNIDYNTLQQKTNDANVESNKRESAIFKP